jgi:hypothetical protein
MKKNKFSVLGILVLVLVLELAFVGCDNGTGGDEPYDGPKTIKITGFNVADAKQLLIFFTNESSFSYPPVAGGRTAWSEDGLGSDITIELKDGTDQADGETWTGTGTYYIWIQVGFPSPTKRSVYHYTVDGIPQQPPVTDGSYDALGTDGITNAASINIKDAVTTLNFVKFVYRGEHPTAG